MSLLVEVEGAEQTAGRAALHNIDGVAQQAVFIAYAPVGECSLDLLREGKQGIELGPRQVVAGEFILAQESSRRADPTGLAVVGPGAVAAVGWTRTRDGDGSSGADAGYPKSGTRR